MPRRFLPYSFVAIFLVFLLSCLFASWHNYQDYIRPNRYIPLRHALIPPALKPTQELYTWLKPVETKALQVHGFGGPHISTELANIVGVRGFLGSSGEIISARLNATLFSKIGTVNCQSPASVPIKDNAWNDFFLTCTPAHGLSGKNSDREIQVRIDHESSTPVALYAAASENQADAKIVPAVHLIQSKYKEDKPPKLGFHTLFGQYFLWNSELKGFFNISLLILVVFLLAYTLSHFSALSFKHKIKAKCLIAFAAAIWLLLILSFSITTPPFQNPDEPQHALGLIKFNLPADAYKEFRGWLLEEAQDHSFLEAKQGLRAPILVDHTGKLGFGDSDFHVAPHERSTVYGRYSSFLIPQVFKLLQYSKEPSANSLWLLRISMLIFPAVLGVFIFVALLRSKQFEALILLGICLLNPVSVSLLSSVSNYGWAIVVGACCSASLLAARKDNKYGLFGFIAGLLTPALVDSATPLVPCLLTIPIIAACQHLITSGSSGSLHLVRSRSQKLLKTSAYFSYPIGFGLGILPFSSLIAEKFSRPSKNLMNALSSFLPESLTTILSTVVDWCLSYPAIPIAALWSLMFFYSKIRREAALQSIAISPARQWHGALTAAVFLLFGAQILSVLYPQPLFATNIYRLTGASKPQFFEFAKQVTEAFLSQFVHVPQDYFLWQTYFLAYGWLDTVAPQLVYFALKLLLMIAIAVSICAVIWKLREGLLVVVTPLLLSVTTWYVLLFGAWGQGHTLLGRYLLPIFGLLALPFLNSYFILFQESEQQTKFAPLIAIILGFVLLSLAGSFYLIPQRFMVGG